MIDESLVKSLVEQSIEGSDKFIVDVKIAPGNVIEVILDSDTSVTIDDCVNLSRDIESSIDRDIEDFELTVYSAGLSEPLKLLRQYKKHIGKEVEVLLKTGNKQKGMLVSVDDEGISISYQIKELLEVKKRKQLVDKSESYGFDQIKSTKLVINFK